MVDVATEALCGARADHRDPVGEGLDPRDARGVVADPAELQFKEGDKLRLLLPCQTTDRLTLFATNGKAYHPEGRRPAARPRRRPAGAAAGGTDQRGR